MVDIDRTSFDCADTFAFLREDCAAGNRNGCGTSWRIPCDLVGRTSCESTVY